MCSNGNSAFSGLCVKSVSCLLLSLMVKPGISYKAYITYLNCDIHLSNTVDTCGQNKNSKEVFCLP